MKTAVPSRKQLEFQDLEFGLFLHFGIRTFYEGHRDWDAREMSPSAFNPTQLDCNQWAETAKKAGLRYMVLVAKHHDGFANWPSKYTDFSVAATPWKDGKGDVVREFTDACRRNGLKAGLYYSPAEWHSPLYQDPRQYDDYFIKQIGELLTNYGEISVLWFDGSGSEKHTYDWARIMPEVRRMQPNMLIFNMGDPDYRWVGNEAGLAPMPCWNTIEAPAWGAPCIFTIDQDHPSWQPAECDCMMRYCNWFYQDSDVDTVKSVEELMGIYYYSVGRGCNLLLNIGPDRRGLLPDRDGARLLEFGDEIRRRFARPLATVQDFAVTNGHFDYKPESPVLIDHVVLQEDLTNGEHVRRFAISVDSTPAGLQPIVVHEGQNIGHKAICWFPLVKAAKVRLEITQADGPVKIRSFQLHNSAR
ncbi:MAG TPA: alpha-L-fucosidase [Planctomycetota bacterium]|nr:alpha-L-fucosidase [Planctomycetota bacterium]